MFTFHVLSISEREAIQKNSQLRKTEVQKYFKICEIYKIYILVKTLILVGRAMSLYFYDVCMNKDISFKLKNHFLSKEIK